MPAASEQADDGMAKVVRRHQGQDDVEADLHRQSPDRRDHAEAEVEVIDEQQQRRLEHREVGADLACAR